MEIFKDIPGYEGIYQISNLGNVRSIHGGRWLNGKIINIKPQNNSRGYFKVILQGKKFYVHRLVMLAFKGENKLDVNHKNGIKSDNRLENLEYCNRSQNIRHSFDILGRTPSFLNKKGILHHSSKKVNQYDLEGNYIATYGSLHEAGEVLNICYQNIQKVCTGKRKIAYGYKWSYAQRQRTNYMNIR